MFNIFGGGDSGSFGGFTLGLGGNLGRVTPNSSGAVIPTAGTVMQPSGVGAWFDRLSGTALDWYKTTQAVDIAGQQVRGGQYPTVIGQNGSLSGTANVSTSGNLGASFLSPGLLFMLAIVVVIVLVLKK